MLLNKKFTKLKIALPLQLIIYGADELYHFQRQIHDIKHVIYITYYVDFSHRLPTLEAIGFTFTRSYMRHKY